MRRKFCGGGKIYKERLIQPERRIAKRFERHRRCVERANAQFAAFGRPRIRFVRRLDIHDEPAFAGCRRYLLTPR